MALSLNDGSYGLLMDPLNGVADIENRELRLVSNYGFIEDPVRMIRAARFMARLGWQMDEKTQERYETGKKEGYISAWMSFQRGYETEEIFHEEDPLRVLRRLEAEGWMKHLFPALASAKANVAELERLRESQMQVADAGDSSRDRRRRTSPSDGQDGSEGRGRAEEELCAAGVCAGDCGSGGRGEGVCCGVLGQGRGDAVAGVEAAALGQAGGGAVGRAYVEERGDSGEVQGLLYGVGAGEAEDSVRDDAGDADHSGFAGVCTNCWTSCSLS